MAGNLDELIVFLLEEIALGGETGLSFQDLAELVSKFYQVSLNDQSRLSEKSPTLKVDRPFLSKIWMWLAQHPDVSIGKNNQYNSQSLDDIERKYPGYTLLDRYEAGSNIGEQVSSSTNASALPDVSDGVSSAPAPTQSDNGPHLHVNDERIAIAICGHPPDPAKVLASEWALLLYIAASKSEGILQGDLVRVSGQDKRSVPKRTDVLHEKGYILKQTIYLKGNKTSRLYLRRFVDAQQSESSTGNASVDQPSVRHVARQIFEVLKNNPLIPQEDLAEALGMTKPGRARILSQLIRLFGRLGCTKRVKTAFEPSARSKDVKLCVQYLREPTEDDWKSPDVENYDLDQPVETLASFFEAEASRSSVDMVDEIVGVNELDQAETMMENGETVKSQRLVVPQWNPDRVLANVLFEVAREAGSVGMKNRDARSIITGPFIKRTLESHLVKISNRALQAQPAHLRHLAILRTHIFQDGILQYVHYAFEMFGEKVANGQASWKEVFGGEQFLKELTKSGKDAEAIMEAVPADSFGFPAQLGPISQVQNGETTASQLLQDPKVRRNLLSLGEPSSRKFTPMASEVITNNPVRSISRTPLEDLAREALLPNQLPGPSEKTTTVGIDAPNWPDFLSTGNSNKGTKSSKVFQRKPKQIDESGQIVKGRPRKFMRGTEKYWRDTFMMIVEEKRPGFFKDRGKAGLMDNAEALETFRNRPADFDVTILQAMEQGLPVASEIRQISQDWINQVSSVMNRAANGLYISPPGFQSESRKKRSQILILRSSRLQEIDFVDRSKCWPWQMLTSSVSHSFRYQRFYPRLGNTPTHTVMSLELPRIPKKSVQQSTSPRPGPPRGLFTEDVTPNHVIACHDNQSMAANASIVPEISEVGHPTITNDSVVELLNNHHGELHEHVRPSTPIHTKSDTQPSMIQPPGQADDAPVLLKPRLNIINRSNRRRKPTQKVTENLEALGIKFDDAQGPQMEAPNDIINIAIGQQTDLTTSNETPAQLSQVQVAIPEAEDSNIAPTSYPDVDRESDGFQTPVTPLAERTIQLNDTESITYADAEAILAQWTTRMSELTSQEHIDDHANSNDPQEAGTPTIDNLPSCRIELTPNVDIPRVAPPEEDSTKLALDGLEHVTSLTAEDMETPQGQATESSTSVIATESEKRAWASINDVENTLESDHLLPNTPVAKRIRTSKTDPDPSIEIKRAQVSRLCRTLVLELLGMCSGLAPNVPWTLRRAMVPKWHETGVKPDQLNAKNVRAAIKTLSESGKIKQITFAFRAKNGTMVKMSVIALRGVDPTSPAVLELQRKMTEMEPADYVPPELEAESHRIPNEANRNRYSQEINREGSCEVTTELSPITTEAQTPKKRTRKSSARSRSAKILEEHEDPPDPPGSPEAVSGPSLPSPEPSISPNTGFLTLCVPRLKELNIPTGHHVKYTLPPDVVPTQTEPITSTPNTPPPKRKVGRPKGSRSKRITRFDPDTHQLIWKKHKSSKFPSCLDDIPNIRLSRDQALLSDGDNKGLTFFEAEIDTVASWEKRSADLFDGKCKSLVFINHSINQKFWNSLPNSSSTVFKSLIEFDRNTGQEIKTGFPETESWGPFIAALQPERVSTSQTEPKTVGRRKRKSTKRTVDVAGLDQDEDHDAIAATKKQKRATKHQRPRRSLHATRDEDYVEPSTKLPFKRQRTGQLLRFMSEEEKYHLIVAVIVVRTLIGGIEKFIDWEIVNKILPAQDEQNMKEAWKTMSHRFRADIADMTEGLQYRYIEALATAQVPSVNFDLVHATDWQGIFQWGLLNLDKSIVKNIEELPATRGELLQRNDYVFNEVKGTREILGYNYIQTIPKKEETLSSVIFGDSMNIDTMLVVPLGSKLPTEVEECNIEITRARSWIKAVLLTPETTFDGKKIQNKLLTLANTSEEVEWLLEKAVKSLQRDKIVSRSHRPSRGGNTSFCDDDRSSYLGQFELSAKFFEQFDFRRMITPSMLRRAAKYKLEILDQAFNTGSSVVVPKETILDDGEMVAIFNLFAMGMLRIRPGDNVPASRWGLEWQKHGYTTRMIDKSALGFGVILTPLKHTYICGDPLATLRSTAEACVPRDGIDQVDNMGFIPVWFDINHDFQPNMWETVLGAILGLVSTRPGVNTREIARTLWYGVSTQEVTAVLDWAQRLKLIARTSSASGWESREWWWMGLGTGGGWRVDREEINEAVQL